METQHEKSWKKVEKVRVAFYLTRSQREQLKRYIPWGQLSQLFAAIAEDLIKVFERKGSVNILGKLLSRQLRTSDIIKGAEEMEVADFHDSDTVCLYCGGSIGTNITYVCSNCGHRDYLANSLE